MTRAGATTDGRLLTFVMEFAEEAGSEQPVPIGQLAGVKVESYLWPTSLDPEVSVVHEALSSRPAAPSGAHFACCRRCDTIRRWCAVATQWLSAR